MAAPQTDLPRVPEADGRPSRSTTVWRAVGVAVMLAIALFWFWIFSGAARKTNPDRLEDRAWAERAETTCTAVMERIDERGVAAGDQTRSERADDIDTSTAELRAMLDDLASPLPAGEGDRAVVEPWLADWRSLLGDRDRYADAIRVNPDARFLTTEKFNDPLDTVVETFADVNDMPACGPAGDVG